MRKFAVIIEYNGHKLCALIDTGSTHNFIHPDIVQKFSLPTKTPPPGNVTMASKSCSKAVSSIVNVDLTVCGRSYTNTSLKVLDNLCVDVILGNEFQDKHESITFKLNGALPALEIDYQEENSAVCGLTKLNVEPPDVFANIDPDYKPIAAKSRRYSKPDRDFIKKEIQQMLKDDIIEPSNSPWRSQPVVTKDDETHRKRMVVDYSETVNKYTQLDAYPVPRIDDFVNKIAQYKVFTAIDLKSAYFQVPLKDSDKPFTAFEGDGGLWQFKRMPPGITNGGSCFQRCMNNFIAEEEIKDTFAYFDNLYICGHDDNHHDRNFSEFSTAAEKFNLTVNRDKCNFKTRKLSVLGSLVENGTVRPDPERLRPLRELPSPHNAKSLKRVLGLFSHYSKWIPQFSDRVSPLLDVKRFPLNEVAEKAFQELKIIIENSVVQSIDETLPFEVECDASDIALSGVLNQGGRPVAFFARTLQKHEKKWPPVEKEASSIIESVQNWKHFLTGNKFTLITDQEAVSYIFHIKHKSKIKNDKLYRWRLNLACYSFDIVYRPGEQNVVADTFSRAFCSGLSFSSLSDLHRSLCHPGVTRMAAFVRSRNLPYSVDDVRKMIKSCRVCAKCKPQFHRPPKVSLIKATQPFERLNLDFKGPLPSRNKNRYILTLVDEYTRYPFAIPCTDISAATVNRSLCQVFSLFGVPSFIHSDRGSSFMSKELRNYLSEKGIATSRTTPYNPKGNGLVERYNGTIWKAVTLALHEHNLPMHQWESVLPDALHSIRSLISTATNSTPHERMFTFQRRTSSGVSLPSWLSSPGPVLLRRHVRQSKYEPLVDEVDLIEANTQYAFIRFPDGREDTVNLHDLAPYPTDSIHDSITEEKIDNVMPSELVVPSEQVVPSEHDLGSTGVDSTTSVADPNCVTSLPVKQVVDNGNVLNNPPLRRSTRVKKVPVRFVSK